ncbi:Cyclophilin-like [Chitinophaga dinghuensis]|uniref:Cyclophilin-like n=1 Tax=Chitinophaga dinghuensis TaxID=1539050 RepID=A0A327VSF4_9BACT|nr:cyclophilin-like fold protein [Chitinophaga dinghuensis]RAJ77307.1 Cyclophilin-like [Chitinophaga dinghuensis]
MNQLLFIFIGVFSLSTIGASCGKAGAPIVSEKYDTITYPTKSKMKITIGNHSFTATLDDNAAATELKAMLPMTINMTELNANEKYAELPRSLPTYATNPGTIQAGDLMLYGSSTLVLFYKTFRTSYSYTKLGHIDDINGFQGAVGTGSVSVTYESESF